MDILSVAEKFGVSGAFTPVGNGHINDFRSADGKYILQRINTSIFTDPQGLMENIVNVTEFIREKLLLSGRDPERETLHVIPAKGGAYTVTTPAGQVFRMYDYISGTKTVEPGEGSLEDLYAAGLAFGDFQCLLSDFPAETLHESIPDFHNTVKRVENLKKTVLEDSAGRAGEIPGEIEAALKWADFADVVLSCIADGSVPLSVTHNDTKINNVLFDAGTGAPLAVIDLDTVMPGSRLYDFGDCLRAAGNTALEDEKDLSKVHFSEEAFRAFAKGYLKNMGNVLTPKEWELLPFSIILLTYECGIRFLTDYLEGDVYFKTAYPEHNLVRWRNQRRLVEEILPMEERLHKILREIREEMA